MPTTSPASFSSRRSKDQRDPVIRIGDFERGGQIGQGSFATVYQGKDMKRGGYVAIKSVTLAKLNKKLKENLYVEIDILRGLEHPHIVSLLDCVETTVHIHIVMEFCPWGDLAGFIKKRDQAAKHPGLVDLFKRYPNPKAGLNEVVVRHFVKQLASALEFLRAKELVHRDVKPQNLLINPSPEAWARRAPETEALTSRQSSIPISGLQTLPLLKLADFGFARSLPTTALAETLCGSPLYMAPEILRYEKYDATADLWSVGTVLYEMATGKPPFRASNHIDLLRKIEQAQDVIKFPEEPPVSRDIKTLVRSLMKRNPVERMGFSDFFDSPVIKGEIPNLVGNDRPRRQTRPEIPKSHTGGVLSNASHDKQRRPSNRSAEDASEKFVDAVDYIPTPTRRPQVHHAVTAPPGAISPTHRRPGSISSQNPSPKDMPPPTIPASQVRRTNSRASPDHRTREERLALAAREAKERERAEHDVAFERDYVVVEKRAVEVNAIADEFAASPKIHGDHRHDNPQSAMMRRNTTQNTAHTGGAQLASAKATQSPSGKRPTHERRGSYEQRIRSASSASSAITKAISLASGRLMNFGISPPLGANRQGAYSPVYPPFPSYPATGQVAISHAGKSSAPLDEDTRVLHAIEESAHRSDVVYGFAEVKYKQIVPLAPSAVEDQGLGLQEAGIPDKGAKDEDDGLTIDTIVTISEEALVLYVKALSLLARAIDIAGAWWSKKNRADTADDGSPSPRSQLTTSHAATGARINKVVQWVRDRFNEVLEKADFVRLKLVDAQKRLPLDHSSHPNNYASADSTSTLGTTAGSAETVRVSPGVSAEKLMYTRALEMGKTAAVNELVAEDLPGCELSYITAIRMLEAVLDSDDDFISKKPSLDKDGAGSKGNTDDLFIPEDRESIVKVMQSFRSRLLALQKKLKVISERNVALPPARPNRSPGDPSTGQIQAAGSASPRS